MKLTESDIERRKPVWDMMQMIYMDTDPKPLLDRIAEVCIESGYSEDELREILFKEVFPACRLNMLALPAPEWAGFDIEKLTERILKKQRHGKRDLFFNRSYTRSYWNKIKERIDKIKENKTG